ncbi:MAG: phage holin family protein [Hyphomonadaceae bacterium]
MSTIPELTKELAGNFGDMIRNELKLARTEALESASKMGGGLVYVGVGAAFAAAAVTLICMAGIEALPDDIPRWASYAMAGIAAGIAALIFMQTAKSAFAPKSLTLPKTREQIGRDLQNLKEHIPS